MEDFLCCLAKGHTRCRRDAAPLKPMRFSSNGGVIRVRNVPYNSVNLQQGGGNMATLRHEGHANQLDLLIRAGNVSLVYSRRPPGSSFLSAGCGLGSLGRCAPVRRRLRRSNGGQSGSDHLGSSLHGAASRRSEPL